MAQAERRTRAFRLTGLLCGLGCTAFWFYTFYYISRLPPGDHTGFQWLGEMPLTMIWLFLTLPALGLSLSRRLAAFSAGLGVASIVANAMIWLQLLSEYAGYR